MLKMKNWIRAQTIPQAEQLPLPLQMMALLAVMWVAAIVLVICGN